MSAVVAVFAAWAPIGQTAKKPKPHTCKIHHHRNAVKFYRQATWKWQSQMDSSRTKTSHSEKRSSSCKYVRWAAKLWRARSKDSQKQFWQWYRRTYAKWECIHNHEAGWHGDNNPTYDGGLQMDYQFQTTYGLEFYRRWGNASNWPVWAQLLTAERAYRTRGFGPWPTRSYCGV